MNFHVLTLFPQMIMDGLGVSITGRAMENGLISVEAIDIREYSTDKHRHVDDVPYGVLLTERVGENGRFLFVMNTVPEARTVVLPACTDAMTGEARGGETALPPYGVIAVRR